MTFSTFYIIIHKIQQFFLFKRCSKKLKNLRNKMRFFNNGFGTTTGRQTLARYNTSIWFGKKFDSTPLNDRLSLQHELLVQSKNYTRIFLQGKDFKKGGSFLMEDLNLIYWTIALILSVRHITRKVENFLVKPIVKRRKNF